LELTVNASVIRVSVTDCDARHLPFLTPPDPRKIGGLGLYIVDDVSRSWGCDTDGEDKTVWFELSEADDAESL
jgi:hypothetical protein